MGKRMKLKAPALRRAGAACLAAALALAMCVPATALAANTTEIGPTDAETDYQEGVRVTLSKSCYWAVEIPRAIALTADQEEETVVRAYGDVGEDDKITVVVQGMDLNKEAYVDLAVGGELQMRASFKTGSRDTVAVVGGSVTKDWSASELAADDHEGTTKDFLSLTAEEPSQVGNYVGYLKYIVNYTKGAAPASTGVTYYALQEGANWSCDLSSLIDIEIGKTTWQEACDETVASMKATLSEVLCWTVDDEGNIGLTSDKKLSAMRLCSYDSKTGKVGDPVKATSAITTGDYICVAKISIDNNTYIFASAETVEWKPDTWSGLLKCGYMQRISDGNVEWIKSLYDVDTNPNGLLYGHEVSSGSETLNMYAMIDGAGKALYSDSAHTIRITSDTPLTFGSTFYAQAD